MEREFSAGGVLVKLIRGRPMVAAIRPRGKPEGVWALPKGNLDPGERPDETALREVLEETGVEGRLVEKLGDVKYTYTRRGGVRVFKIVSFYLLRAGRGRIGEIEERDADRGRRGALAAARRGAAAPRLRRRAGDGEEGAR